MPTVLLPSVVAVLLAAPLAAPPNGGFSGTIQLPEMQGINVRTSVCVPVAIPSSGAVPPTSGADGRYAGDAFSPIVARSADVQKLEEIKRLYFSNSGSSEKRTARRAEGIAKLKAFTDQSAMVPMYDQLRHEADDVVTAMLDHFATLGQGGQAALAWIAINDEDARLRHEATRRITRPPTPAVLGVLDNGLRSNTHLVANRAGALAGALSAIETIPLLIFAQATRDRVERQGDLAWISIGTQMSYVANVVPVVGAGAGAFQPVIGVIQEGVVMRVTDAVVTTYRTEIHTSLVNMTSADWGQSTESLGYDMNRWFSWFNDEYVPFKKRQVEDVARRERAKQVEREAADE